MNHSAEILLSLGPLSSQTGSEANADEGNALYYLWCNEVSRQKPSLEGAQLSVREEQSMDT